MRNLSLALGALALIGGIAACKKEITSPVKNKSISHLFVSISGIDAAKSLLFFEKADSSRLTPTYQYAGPAVDANGLALDVTRNILFQLSRGTKRIYIYENADSMTAASLPDRSIDDLDLSSAQDLAYDSKNNILYVSNNSDSTIRAYGNADDIHGMATIKRVYKLTAEPWGLAFDKKQGRLLVAMDKDARRVESFSGLENAVSGAVNPTAIFAINTAAALDTNARLHGIDYSEAKDLLVVSDIGQAISTDNSHKSDGAIYLFDNFSAAVSGNLNPSRTIIGNKTQLGNPVAVAINDRSGAATIYVAEKSNGAVLVFNIADNGAKEPKTSYNTSSPEAVCVDSRFVEVK